MRLMNDVERAQQLARELIEHIQYDETMSAAGIAVLARALAAARTEQAERDARIAETMPVFAGPRDVAAAIRAAAASPNTPPAAE